MQCIKKCTITSILLVIVCLGVSYAEEQVPALQNDSVPLGMISSDYTDSSFSVIMVDNQTMEVMHVSSRNVWENVPLPLPEQMAQYKIYVYKDAVYILGGTRTDGTLNTTIWKTEVQDSIDTFAWQIAGSLPVTGQDFYIDLRPDSTVVFNAMKGTDITQYQAVVNSDYTFGVWEKKY